MVATVYTCDRCKLEQHSDVVPDYWLHLSLQQAGPQPLKAKTVDLCPNCRKAFDNWLKS